MTREEMKKKIYEMVLAELQNQFGCGDTVEVGDREVCAEAVADALIEARIGDVSQQAIMSDLGVHKFFMEQAEKELEEERKDGR